VGCVVALGTLVRPESPVEIAVAGIAALGALFLGTGWRAWWGGRAVGFRRDRADTSGIDVGPARALPSGAELGEYEAGYRAYVHGQFDEAITILRCVIEQSPEDVDAHYYLGLALHETGLDKEAVASLGTVVARRPLDPFARYHLGAALITAGREADAIRTLGGALALKPDLAEASRLLTSTLESAGALPLEPSDRRIGRDRRALDRRSAA